MHAHISGVNAMTKLLLISKKKNGENISSLLTPRGLSDADLYYKKISTVEKKEDQ